MGCTSPLKRWIIGHTEDGKTEGIVTSANVQYLWKMPNGRFERVTNDDNFSDKDNFRNSSFYLKFRDRIISDFTYIPCGKCNACRIKRSRDNATKCVLESLYHDDSCFLTLTYNDDHLPPKHHNAVNFETGEFDGTESPIHSLRRKDLSDFNKRLRRYVEYHFDKKIRFFGCGEYGSLNFRPHYHLLVFGYNPTDKIPYKRNHLGQLVYTSPQIEKLWGHGFVTVGECNYETAAYTARYVQKKNLGAMSYVYDLLDFTPEFSLFPTRGGALGKQYYEDHKDDIYKTDQIIIPNGIDKAIKARPPAYFDKLYDVENPERMDEIREKRKLIQEINRQLAMQDTGLTYEKILENQAINLEHRLDKLKREL